MNCSFRLFKYDQKTCNDAINTLRSSGSAVPKKVTGKYIYTLEAIKTAQNISYGDKVLILGDFGTENSEIKTIISQLNALQSSPEFVGFRNSVGYDTQAINMSEYIDNDTTGNRNNLNGKIVVKAISRLNLDINGNIDAIDPFPRYDGSDINVYTYRAVIVFTKILPLNGDYGDTKHTVDINQYSPSLGINLKNYMNSGGNIILGNNVWQNLGNNQGIPNFSYSSAPFVFKQNYVYSKKRITIEKINFLVPNHPIFKTCDGEINLSQPFNSTLPTIIENIILQSDSTLLATINDFDLKGVPFMAVYNNPNGGKSVGINIYLGPPSNGNATGNLNFAKMLFNAIFWFYKINI
jgi:hypothetical protein